MMKTSSPKIIILTLASFLTLGGRGQNNMTQNEELDKKFTPNPNSIFNNLNNKKTDLHHSDEVEIRNNIKFCPTALIRQKLMFFYEREILKGFALNLGIGKAFGEDQIQKVFFDIATFSTNDLVLSPYTVLKNSLYKSSTPYIYVGAKIYFSGQSFDGGFLEFAYKNERSNYIVNPYIDSYLVEGSNAASFKMNALSIGYGYTGTSGTKSRMTHEFFVNVGIKYFNYSRFDIVNATSANGGATQIYTRSAVDKTTRLLPCFNIGYCIGFGFK